MSSTQGKSSCWQLIQKPRTFFAKDMDTSVFFAGSVNLKIPNAEVPVPCSCSCGGAFQRLAGAERGLIKFLICNCSTPGCPNHGRGPAECPHKKKALNSGVLQKAHCSAFSGLAHYRTLKVKQQPVVCSLRLYDGCGGPSPILNAVTQHSSYVKEQHLRATRGTPSPARHHRIPAP